MFLIALIGTKRALVCKRNYPAAVSDLSGECVLVGITYREGTDEHECRIQRVTL